MTPRDESYADQVEEILGHESILDYWFSRGPCTLGEAFSDLLAEIERLRGALQAADVMCREYEAEIERLRGALAEADDLIEECWNQWAYRVTVGGKEVLIDGGLSTLEAIRRYLDARAALGGETAS